VPLHRDYSGQHCSLARSLEIVGERWTLLILRDAFYGVRHFGDFAEHLGIGRAILSERLSRLVAEGVLARSGGGRTTEYELLPKGIALWPMIYTAIVWGDEHYAPKGPRRVFLHAGDGAQLDETGRCTACGAQPAPAEIVIAPGPGHRRSRDDDVVTVALRSPHRLLEPLLTHGTRDATAQRARQPVHT
jgi:DNA-binding HxlR family transcriptional regulator